MLKFDELTINDKMVIIGDLCNSCFKNIDQEWLVGKIFEINNELNNLIKKEEYDSYGQICFVLRNSNRLGRLVAKSMIIKNFDKLDDLQQVHILGCMFQSGIISEEEFAERLGIPLQIKEE